MSNLSITVTPTPGTHIKDAAVEACALATRLDIWVNFKFNGVDCNAEPHSDPEKLADAQQIMQDQKTQYKFAHAYSDGSARPELVLAVPEVRRVLRRMLYLCGFRSEQ